VFTERKRVCQQYGVAADVPAYTEGYIAGVKRYCTVEGGYAAGERGDKYQDVCPSPLDVAFAEGYKKGWEVYVAIETANNIQKRIEQGRDGGTTGSGAFKGASQSY